MDLSTVRNRRKKSLFRPWNSYLAKKAAAEAATAARNLETLRANAEDSDPTHISPLVRLTVRLIDTYEGINTAYYERKKAAGHDSDSATPSAHATTWSASGSINNDHQPSTAPPTAPNPHNPSSPLSIQYCDDKHDYIVRTGEMFNNRYMLEKVIGRGSFGQVVRAYDTRENTHVAIKIIKNNSLYVEHALSEVRMTSFLNRIDPEDAHSIMRLRDKFIFRGHQCLVLELLSFSLYDLLRSTQFYGVSLNLVRKFCKQILSCLAFLACPDVNIVHCDLKPENVLLRHPQRSAIKVVDFGASCRITESMYTYVQSRFYRAPEVILGLPYGTQVDVWSLGCMLIELHTGYPVFAGKDEADQMAIIVERLGMPPKHMLDNGKKTNSFFEKDLETGKWKLRADISPHSESEPGSKPLNAFVDYHTGTTNGRRKRVSGGHSEADYEIFLSLAQRMLEYDPKGRISADEALRDAFVLGVYARSGRDSPPPIPQMGAVEDHVVKDVEPGRQAPVQRVRKGVGVNNVVAVHTDASITDLSEIAELSTDVGGKLRLSKSEPAFEALPKKTFVFKTSDWAEEVGIEPPPWRSGGSACSPENESVKRRGMRRQLPPAGGGCRQIGWNTRRDDVAGNVKGCNQWEMRKAKDSFSFGIGSEHVTDANGIDGRLQERGGYRGRGFNPALPRGHGNAMLLFM